MRISKNPANSFVSRTQMLRPRPSQGKKKSLFRSVFSFLSFFSLKKIVFMLGGAGVIAAVLFYVIFFTDFGSRIAFGLKGEAQGRTNMLVMGIGGADHPGGDLADMITLVSIDHKTKQIGLLSFPRDIEVTTKYGTTKINSVHAEGEHKDKDGPAAMKQIIFEMTGQSIHYYVRLDFPGFVNLIDTIGGVDVDVEKTYLDWMYPNPQYDGKISFKQGIEHLNGQWALNYARSRTGDSGEGSDFRRAKRHQDILAGLKAKVLEDKTYLNPGKIMEIVGILKEHISTDLSARDVARLAHIYSSYHNDRLITSVLDNSAQGVLQAATSANGSYVLRPKTGDFSQIEEIAASLFGEASQLVNTRRETSPQAQAQSVDEDVGQEVATHDEAATESDEQATIEIQNATSIAGLATRKAKEIDDKKFDVVNVSNAKNKDFATNVVFDNLDGEKSDALAALAKQFDAKVINDKVKDSTADFVLVIVKE